jgi:hypothetical protein
VVHVGEVRTLQGKWPRLVSSVAADIQQAELDVKASPLKRGAAKRMQLGGAGGIGTARIHPNAHHVRIALRTAKTLANGDC